MPALSGKYGTVSGRRFVVVEVVGSQGQPSGRIHDRDAIVERPVRRSVSVIQHIPGNSDRVAALHAPSRSNRQVCDLQIRVRRNRGSKGRIRRVVCFRICCRTVFKELVTNVRRQRDRDVTDSGTAVRQRIRVLPLPALSGKYGTVSGRRFVVVEVVGSQSQPSGRIHDRDAIVERSIRRSVSVIQHIPRNSDRIATLHTPSRSNRQICDLQIRVRRYCGRDGRRCDVVRLRGAALVPFRQGVCTVCRHLNVQQANAGQAVRQREVVLARARGSRQDCAVAGDGRIVRQSGVDQRHTSLRIDNDDPVAERSDDCNIAGIGCIPLHRNLIT